MSVTTALALANCGSASSINILTLMDADISASCLTSLSGSLYVDGNTNGGSNTVLKTIGFTLLTYTPGYLQVWNQFGNTLLTIINLPSLEYVGQYLHIYYNSALTWLNLHSLTYVGLFFGVDSTGLTSLDLPSLTFVGQYFAVDYNSNLTKLTAPVLVKTAGLYQNWWAVHLCENSGSFSYSTTISHSAVGKLCWLPPSSCGATTTCT